MGTGRTDEFCKDAVRIALTSGLSRRQVADDLVGGFSTLNKWVSAHRDTDVVSAEDRDLARENERIRREVRILKEERDILKKARLFFDEPEPHGFWLAKNWVAFFRMSLAHGIFQIKICEGDGIKKIRHGGLLRSAAIIPRLHQKNKNKKRTNGQWRLPCAGVGAPSPAADHPIRAGLVPCLVAPRLPWRCRVGRSKYYTEMNWHSAGLSADEGLTRRTVRPKSLALLWGEC